MESIAYLTAGAPRHATSRPARRSESGSRAADFHRKGTPDARAPRAIQTSRRLSESGVLPAAAPSPVHGPHTRIISCADDVAEHIALPRGCLDDLASLLSTNGSRLALEDAREPGQPLACRFEGALTPVQEAAAAALVAHDAGVLVAPPGVGKTVIGAYVIAQRATSTLVLVHRRPLLDQWVNQLAMFAGVPPASIGQIAGGKRKPNGLLDVAMIQSLVREGVVDDNVSKYGHVVVDECHHVPAISFESVLKQVKARFITGLTATPRRRDGHHPIARMQLGPVRYTVDAKAQAGARPFTHKLVVRETGLACESDLKIQDIYRALASDAGRKTR